MRLPPSAWPPFICAWVSFTHWFIVHVCLTSVSILSSSDSFRFLSSWTHNPVPVHLAIPCPVHRHSEWLLSKLPSSLDGDFGGFAAVLAAITGGSGVRRTAVAVDRAAAAPLIVYLDCCLASTPLRLQLPGICFSGYCPNTSAGRCSRFI